MFRYSEDRLPIAVILTVTLVDACLYITSPGIPWLIGYVLLMLIPKGTIGAWNHHHQHVLTFRSSLLNRLYEVCLALHTGVTSNLWVLHHVLGHHVNYLDQTKDQSRWKRLDGSRMGILEYTLSVTLTAYGRGYAVGRNHPKHQRVYLVWTAITALVLGTLLWFKPIEALILFVVPMITSLLFTSWVTYDHHAGLEADTPYEASHNIMNKTFNALTGNLGYHTAHHYRQAVHWSKLPELHATIAEKIPDALFRESTFDFLFPPTPVEAQQD